jgi:hypothetical protein
MMPELIDDLRAMVDRGEREPLIERCLQTAEMLQ